jgi:hypothetical protein
MIEDISLYFHSTNKSTKKSFTNSRWKNFIQQTGTRTSLLRRTTHARHRHNPLHPNPLPGTTAFPSEPTSGGGSGQPAREDSTGQLWQANAAPIESRILGRSRQWNAR